MAKGKRRKIPGRLARTIKAGRLGGVVGSSYLGGKILDKLRPEDKRRDAQVERHVTNAKRVVSTMMELRGPMMKIGQLLSTHGEALPGEFVDVLAPLQSRVPAMPWKQIRGQIRSELGAEPDEAFVSFEREAFAAASIGQVHRAEIETEEGIVAVAVKVQYPGATSMIESDLSNMSSAVAMVRTVAGDLFGQGRLDFTPVYEEIAEHLRQETDYAREAYNAQLMAAVLAEHEHVVVPRVFNTYSSLRVVTYEFIEGQPLADFIESGATQEQRDHVTAVLAASFWEQIFGNGIMHADPHPGNYLILDDGRIALLDFGCVKIFDERWVEAFARLVQTKVHGDDDGQRQAIVDLGLVEDAESIDEMADMALIGDYFSAGLMEDAPFRFRDYDYVGKARALVEHFLSARRVPRSQRDFIFLTRVALGLYEYYSQLDSHVNFHQIAMPHVDKPYAGRRVAIPDYYLGP